MLVGTCDTEVDTIVVGATVDVRVSTTDVVSDLGLCMFSGSTVSVVVDVDVVVAAVVSFVTIVVKSEAPTLALAVELCS